jgi:hypothetical protein
MTRAGATAALIAGAATVLLAGCAPDAARADRGVPDDEIIAGIAALDGVVATDVEFDDSFGYGARYRGGVDVARDADAGCVLTQTLGLLRQGRPGVALSSVMVRQGDTVLTLNDLSPAEAQVVDAMTAAPDGAPVVPGC